MPIENENTVTIQNLVAVKGGVKDPHKSYVDSQNFQLTPDEVNSKVLKTHVQILSNIVHSTSKRHWFVERIIT